MRIEIEEGASRIQAALMEPLARSLVQLGHSVLVTSASARFDRPDLRFVWGGRPDAGVPTFCCENGWLPRWHYQIGLGGINARHHAAPWRWDGRCVDVGIHAQRIRMLRTATPPRPYSGYADPQEFVSLAGAPDYPYLVVALQVPGDVSLKDGPRKLKTPQALVDFVSAADPPWPLVIKQHPASGAADQALVATRRPGDRLWLHSEGGIHVLLRSRHCVGLVAVNSNSIHDALLWDRPAVALGRGLWPRAGAGARTPVVNGIPKGWDLQLDQEVVAAYTSWVMSLQWTPERAEVLGHVERLLDLVKGTP